MSQPSGYPRIYRLRKRQEHFSVAGGSALFALLALWGLSLVFPLTSERRVALSLVLLTMFCWFCYYGLSLYYEASRTRLVISPEKVEYHTRGYSIITTWDNIASIDVRTSGEIVSGFVLRQNASCPDKQWGWLFRPRRISEDFIPLPPFFEKWEESALAQDIQRYAPRLFTHQPLRET